MITESNLATAQIAQLFGSELLKVQKNAQTDSGAMPDIVKIDPKQFLYNENRMSLQRKVEEQRIIEMLQKEAEAAYPTAEPQLPPMQEPVQRSQAPIQIQPSSVAQHTIQLPAKEQVWSSIASSLERIANTLEKVDFSVKRKRVKRTNK